MSRSNNDANGTKSIFPSPTTSRTTKKLASST